ncbi:uncharacterized protein PADG_00666 [Paracoccidioides brasiliensis Pb18]|uniref:CSC1/OSCA1-like 7TM region domain-containing protein n=1 Tax=Paracoccidioides brasiliensis (strain Pb18) TaxID=502780 RepID=C1G1C6_PARBD|nr:uncharacterized protein PADG_00666 [Paracoccidioides brasiliensis Pb18]EEH44377.1 hypothetical protein PADG_00666 [Paracoccidioides brasiliensis Pb18]ODH53544.1 hypothetical protein GX48_00377 [Paracoccidioides brasiliensis]
MEGAILLARQNGGTSPADQFLSLIQNPFSSAFQLNAFWASFGTSIGLTLLLAAIFSLFRPRNSLVYAPKLKHADRKHAPPPLGKGLLAWLTPVLKTTESQLVDCIGLDATVFLRFTRMCRNMFLVTSIIGCFIMIPVNVSQSNTSRVPGINTFVTMTPQFISTRAIWSHVVCAWIFDIIVAYFLWRNYRAISGLRRHYFQSSEYQKSLHARTILVRHIPPDYRTDEGLLRLTDEINVTPSVPRTSTGRNMKHLPKLIAEHEKMVRQLEAVLAKYFKDPDRLPPKRPTCRPSRKYQEEHGSNKVDAIDYLTDRIRDLEVEIKYVRGSIDTLNAMPYGFASWESIENAHAVAYAARNKHPHGTTITLAPRPNDIIWDNLSLTHKSLKWKRFINFIWSTVLTVLWIAPNAMIAIFLSDLSNLGRVWKGFQRSLYSNPKTWAAVQGIAAPALTSLIYLVLPIVFRRLAIRAGDITKTSRERHVIHSLYAFFVFNNLVVFSLFSAIWAFVTAVIEARNNNSDVWDALVKGQLFLKIMTALCQVSPFWVTWLLQRNLGAAIDLIQIVNMASIWFAKWFMTLTPRQMIEWTAPPPFPYASYYNYFLFYATIALCFATLQPMVLPVTALYFAVDSWLKKYLLLYVFVTKNESGGQFWRVLFNRLLFAVILSNFVMALVVKSRGTWTMVFCLVPLPFLMLGFKWYCRRTFDDGLMYYSRLIASDVESLGPGKSGKKAERIASKFGHPALYKPLMTPMVHAKAAEALEKILNARQGAGVSVNGAPITGEYSDIALHNMSSNEPGRASRPPANAPFEMVPENQLDFSYFKDRPDFRDEFGGGIYGRPEDVISERSHTPRSFFNDLDTPASSRSPSPVRVSRLSIGGGEVPEDGTNPHGHARTPDSNTMPVVPRMARPPLSRQGTSEGQIRPFYNMSNNESENHLLNNIETPPVRSSTDIASYDRWGSNRTGTSSHGPPATHRGHDDTSHEEYRGVLY